MKHVLHFKTIKTSTQQIFTQYEPQLLVSVRCVFVIAITSVVIIVGISVASDHYRSGIVNS